MQEDTYGTTFRTRQIRPAGGNCEAPLDTKRVMRVCKYRRFALARTILLLLSYDLASAAGIQCMHALVIGAYVVRGQQQWPYSTHVRNELS